MVKKIVAASVLIVLIGIVIYNIWEQKPQNEVADNAQTGTEGAYITTQSSMLQEGDVPPDFEMETIDGQVVKLSDLKGKKVMVNFWATWCPPCKEEMPEIQKFYDAHKDDVVILAINSTTDENSEQDVYDFIDEYGYTFPIPMDREGIARDAYNIFAYPTTIFIGTDGLVQHPVKVGPMTYEFMEEQVNALN